MLFKKTGNRLENNFHQKLKYLPWNELTETLQKRIPWQKKLRVTKAQLLDMCTDENLTHAYALRTAQEWQICWEHNFAPTQIEWNNLADDVSIYAHLRIVPGIGPVMLLRFPLTNF